MIKLSYSAAMRYVSSPLSYYLHYIMRLRPIEASSSLVFGSAVDSGINSLLIDLRDGREPSVARAKAAFDTEFETIKATEIKYSKADFDSSLLTDFELVNGRQDVLTKLSLTRKGHLILDAYAEQVLPKLEKVLLVQHEIALTNELGDSLIGVVDLVAQIDGKTYILDNKTSSIKYSEDAASISEQLGTYFEALKDEFKLDGVGFIVIPKNIRKKKEPRVPIEIKLGNVDEKIIEQTFQMYENVLNGIKSGDFRCTRNCCKQPWPCPYKNYCDSNGRDLTGLKIQEKK